MVTAPPPASMGGGMGMDFFSLSAPPASKNYVAPKTVREK